MRIHKLKEQEVGDIIEKENIDLSSFIIKDQLNPKIFNEDKVMKEEVRTRLLMISDDFFETLDIGWVDIDDIILTGSLANYNWSKFSDVDIHILLKFEEVDENVELVREYFMSKKALWNDKHNITIKGYDVELYVQDTNESHVSSGVYSVLWGSWVIEPQRESKEIDAKKVSQKANNIIESIMQIYDRYKRGEYDKVIRSIQTLKEKIRKMRQAGLDREGEYSFENIAFKVLRRMEYLDKLSEIETRAYDNSLTLVESIKYLKS